MLGSEAESRTLLAADHTSVDGTACRCPLNIWSVPVLCFPAVYAACLVPERPWWWGFWPVPCLWMKKSSVLPISPVHSGCCRKWQVFFSSVQRHSLPYCPNLSGCPIVQRRSMLRNLLPSFFRVADRLWTTAWCLVSVCSWFNVFCGIRFCWSIFIYRSSCGKPQIRSFPVYSVPTRHARILCRIR